MSAYGFTLSEEERQQMATFCRLMLDKLIGAPLILNAAQPQQAATSPSLQSPAAASPAPLPTLPLSMVEPRDRWAKDRKGKELPYPAGWESRDVTIWKVEQTTKFLKVTWQSQERGYVDANCFDKDLWPWLILHSKDPVANPKTRLYLKRKGDYINIVGVRA